MDADNDDFWRSEVVSDFKACSLHSPFMDISCIIYIQLPSQSYMTTDNENSIEGGVGYGTF